MKGHELSPRPRRRRKGDSRNEYWLDEPGRARSVGRFRRGKKGKVRRKLGLDTCSDEGLVEFVSAQELHDRRKDWTGKKRRVATKELEVQDQEHVLEERLTRQVMFRKATWGRGLQLSTDRSEKKTELDNGDIYPCGLTAT